MPRPDEDKILEVLRWLLSSEPEDIGTGRSHYLAKVLLEQAEQRPGCWVYYMDHNQRAILKPMQLTVLHLYKSLGYGDMFCLEQSTTAFKLLPKEPTT